MDLPDETRGSLLAKVASGDNSPPLSVTELSGALKRTIETAFGQVRVRGEISGFKRHSSGHCYFSLKDENACMDAVIWRREVPEARALFRPAVAPPPEQAEETVPPSAATPAGLPGWQAAE